MKINVDFTKILTKTHEKMWVALSHDRTKVLGYSANLVELKKQVGGVENIIFMKVLPSDTSFAF